jgi:LmbE family N-acetylglucosaminyl deacetylase
MQRNAEKTMEYYDALYLSPHLDDAALSCGGQIAQATRCGARVLVVTVMAGDPPADAANDYITSLHTRWELGRDAASQRRAEDLAACALLGADALQLDVPDCIYRLDPITGAPLYVSDADIFGDIHPAEVVLVTRLAQRLRDLPAATTIYAPLTVGHHVDHLLVRAAAEQVWGDALRYYEDYPYAQQPGKLEAALAGGAWCVTVIPLDVVALEAKCDAISAFRSQLSTFFADRADLEAQVKGYAARVGGERTY